jgi:hypothetical protein
MNYSKLEYGVKVLVERLTDTGWNCANDTSKRPERDASNSQAKVESLL